MSSVINQTSFIVHLTPREFALITKALCGTLDDYVWKEGRDQEKNDAQEARELGDKLLMQNVRVCEEKVTIAKKCIDAMVERQDDREDK